MGTQPSPCQVHLGAAMLRLGDDLGTRAEALVAELRGGDADAVDIARRQPGRAREPNVKRIQIGTLAAEIPGLQHCGNIADAAATDFGVAERIVDDPFIDRAGLVEVGRSARRDLVGDRLDDAVG